MIEKMKVEKKLLVLGFLVCFIFASLNSVYAIDEGSEFISDISSGVTRGFYIGDVLGFDTLGGRHTFLLSGVKEDIVTVRVSEPAQSAAMAVGEEKKFDFNGDDIADVYVKINGITNPGKAANVTVRTISESMSVVPEVIEPVEPAAPEPVAPVEEQQEILIDKLTEPEKSSSVWIWIVAVVVVVAVASYFVFRAKKRNRYFHKN